MTKENGQWKVNQAIFQGYVKRALEGIDKRFDKNDENIDKLFCKLSKNENAIERLKVKMGVISAIAGVIFATAWGFIKSLMGK